MKVIVHKKDNKKVLLLATSEEDKEALRLLYDNHIVFGLYQIWLRSPGKQGEDRPEIKPLLERLPHLQGIVWLNVVKGFVPREETKDLSKERKTLFDT